MLRMVLNAKRWRLEVTSSQGSACADEDDDQEVDFLESWPKFLKRTARWTESQLKEAGQSEWLDIWKRRQWAWAGKLATRDAEKWSATATLWQPLLHSSQPRGRPRARPRKRWEQDIVSFLVQEAPGNHDRWYLQAQDQRRWSELADKFVTDMSSSL